VRIPIADCHYIGVRGNKTIVFVPIDVPRNRWFPSHPQNICVTRKRFLSKLGNCGCILTLILLEEAVIRGFNSSTPTAIKKKKKYDPKRYHPDIDLTQIESGRCNLEFACPRAWTHAQLCSDFVTGRDLSQEPEHLAKRRALHHDPDTSPCPPTAGSSSG
jgi:hypothetical protein